MNNQETGHLREILTWAKKRSASNHVEFLVEILAPVVLGVKPAELLNVEMNNDSEWEEFKAIFLKNSALRIKEIRELNGRLQVLFYQRDILNAVLTERPILNFLLSLNYPSKYVLEDYLNWLKGKIISVKFPHEIGVFLGYPLKDVVGFMGLLPLPYQRTLGWKIYGDEKRSLDIYRRHSQARDMMKTLANELNNVDKNHEMRCIP